jgi:ABC-type uncharacterized transport system auxiliary subunit
MMNKKKSILIVFIVFLLMMGCASHPVAKYYILDYTPTPDTSFFQYTFPYKVQVKEFDIMDAYDQPRIVVRRSAHEIYYDRLSLWATRPQEVIPSLLVDHINSIKLFEQCKKTFLDERPDYIISGTIHNIEKYDSENITRADMRITLTMTEVATNNIILTYKIVQYLPIYNSSMGCFAEKISDVLHSEFGAFLKEVYEYFNAHKNENASPEEKG